MAASEPHATQVKSEHLPATTTVPTTSQSTQAVPNPPNSSNSAPQNPRDIKV